MVMPGVSDPPPPPVWLQKETGHTGNNLAGHGAAVPSGDADGPSAKLARLDEMEKVRKQFAARLDAPKIKKSTIPTEISHSATDATGGNTTSLRDSMSNEQIAALKVGGAIFRSTANRHLFLD